MNNQLFADTPVNNDENVVRSQPPVPTAVDTAIFETLPDADAEVFDLANAMREEATTFVDESGAIHIDGEANTENMVQVSGSVFGTPSDEEDEVQRLADAMYNDNGDGYWVDEFGRIRLGAEPASSENMTKVDGNIFGAHEDQWYNKNPQLFKAEVDNMRKHYPKAGYSYYKSNGNMFWIVTLNIFQNQNITTPWQFQLVYDKDHPHNHGFGGSIKVVPLKPSMDELRTIAARHGRPGVPHIINNPTYFINRYLCTRWPKDIEDGTDLISSATQAAAWAADWAAHFEVGIRDKRLWNKWCDDDHFRHLQVR